MKKWFSFVGTLLVASGLVMFSISSSASASNLNSEGIADGDYWIGTEVKVDTVTAPTYLELMDPNGVKLDSAGTVCHDFRGGGMGWIAEYRQLEKGLWVKIPTTQGRVNGEGKYIACGVASEAGTYAFFAYYSGAETP